MKDEKKDYAKMFDLHVLRLSAFVDGCDSQRAA
jgi:hypothetical protein